MKTTAQAMCAAFVSSTDAFAPAPARLSAAQPPGGTIWVKCTPEKAYSRCLYVSSILSLYVRSSITFI